MAMLSSNRIKHLQSLRMKKHRDRLKVFLVEGGKIVQEVINSPLQIELICAQPCWIEQQGAMLPKGVECLAVSEKELARVSNLTTPNQAVAVVKQPAYHLPEKLMPGSMSLALETIQDPGNLGTMIRTADWFGIEHIFCSPDTADLYNPKVIQATMGSFIRTKVCYAPLPPLLKKFSSHATIVGAFLSGESIYSARIDTPLVLIIGNESKGISAPLSSCVDKKVQIPRREHPSGKGAESLNAAMAAGIMMALLNQPTPR